MRNTIWNFLGKNLQSCGVPCMGSTRNLLKIIQIQADKFCVGHMDTEGEIIGYVSLGQSDAAATALSGTYARTEGGVMIWVTRRDVTRAIKLARWGERYPAYADSILPEIKESVMGGDSIRQYLCG